MDKRLAAALRKHLDGEAESAERLYREIIQSSPEDAAARHYLGFLLQQGGRLQEAADQLTAAIALDDRHAEWHFNLGIVHARLGSAQEACTAFSRAVALDPHQYFYWTNFGTTYESLQDWPHAEHCYLTAIQIDQDCADAFFLLSALCLRLERFDEARHFNCRGIVVAPSGSHSNIVLGQSLHELGRTDEAIALFENWLKTEPDNPIAEHMLAAYRGQNIPSQCSKRYIAKTFDEFAASFDNVLNRLKYCGPQLVREQLATLNIPVASLSVLDLGCGTGMVGESMRPHAKSLVGVDLSPGMLEKARSRHIYDQLHCEDITAYLKSTQDRYDLVCCMDTFIYLGKLDEPLALVYERLQPGGLLLFSTEKQTDADLSYRLNYSGRYSHRHDYLTTLLAHIGFNINTIRDVSIRTEAGFPIAGQFVCASRA